MDLKQMRTCASLLPSPGDAVVIECLDEIEGLRRALELIRDGQKDAINTNIMDYIDAVLATNRFAVATTMIKNEDLKTNIKTILVDVEAVSKEEAIGKAHIDAVKRLSEHQILSTACIEIKQVTKNI